MSFDDGYADNYKHVFPLLLDHGVSATFFVTAGYVDGDPVALARFQHLRRVPLAELEPLTWSQLREMAEAGMEVGCHTLSHPSLRHLADEDVEPELARSKALIEERLNQPVLGFAYPFGKPGFTYGHREVQAVERMGYSYAVTTVHRDVRPGDSRWQLPRLAVGSRFLLQEQVSGLWDCVGTYNERAPIWLARALSPRGFRASTYGGSYAEMAARGQSTQ